MPIWNNGAVKTVCEAARTLFILHSYDYKKNPEDSEHLLIDKPVEEVVRKIFNLCISGIDPFQIAFCLKSHADGQNLP